MLSVVICTDKDNASAPAAVLSVNLICPKFRNFAIVSYVAVSQRPTHKLRLMKHRGSTFEYEEQRNEDLMRAYRTELSGAAHIRVSRLFQQIVERPSERFWVSEERAFIVVSAMARGDNLETMRPLKREMYIEIYRRYLEIRQKFPDRTMRQLVSMVVNQPAPKFYIEPASARVIVCKIKKKWRNQRRLFLRRRR